VTPTTELIFPFGVDRHFSDSHASPSPSRSREECPCLRMSCSLLQDPSPLHRYRPPLGVRLLEEAIPPPDCCACNPMGAGSHQALLTLQRLSDGHRSPNECSPDDRINNRGPTGILLRI
jgi:hypothetical protein